MLQIKQILLPRTVLHWEKKNPCRQNCHWYGSNEKFVVHEDAYAHFRRRHADLSAEREAWNQKVAASEAGAKLLQYHEAPNLSAVDWPSLKRAEALQLVLPVTKF